nr:T3SS effector OspC family protein [Shigella flexneri]
MYVDNAIKYENAEMIKLLLKYGATSDNKIFNQNEYRLAKAVLHKISIYFYCQYGSM